MPCDPKTMEAIELICDKLADRKAVLFTGAGINVSSMNDKGETFPLGQQLSDNIARDLLDSPGLSLPLDETAEIARTRLGERELNQYLFEQFSRFKPSSAHLAIVQLPWHALYTTNFDLLIEKACDMPGINPAGRIQPVVSMLADLGAFTEEDILYYKLHGSVDIANTKEGRLILTKEDYRFYEEHRIALFKRLRTELLGYTFVFVGYSLRDNNLRAILEDCRRAIGAKTFPQSFSVRPGFGPIEESFWKEKYNIQLLNRDCPIDS